MLKYISLNSSNLDLLDEFLINAGDSLNTFRYFETRKAEVVLEHIVSYVIKDDSRIIGYCHLENDSGKTWLGLCILEKETGKGYGKLILNKLISVSKKLKVESIYLSVDLNNLKAIKLYENFNFKFQFEKNDVYYYKK